MPSRFSFLRNTIAGGLVGLAIIVYGFLSENDVYEYLATVLNYLEHLEVDEFLIAGGCLFLGVFLDLLLVKRARERSLELQEQRLRVLRATMRTVHDIVNNFLNNLILFRLEAEDKGALSEGSLESMDSLIKETRAKLVALGELEGTPEKPMAGGLPGIDYERNLPAEGGSRQN